MKLEKIYGQIWVFKKIVNQEDIYKNIINEQKRINSINGEAKKKDSLSYIQAILDECTNVNIQMFFYERIGNDEEHIECGNQLGEFLHYFINK